MGWGRHRIYYVVTPSHLQILLVEAFSTFIWYIKLMHFIHSLYYYYQYTWYIGHSRILTHVFQTIIRWIIYRFTPSRPFKLRRLTYDRSLHKLWIWSHSSTTAVPFLSFDTLTLPWDQMTLVGLKCHKPGLKFTLPSKHTPRLCFAKPKGSICSLLK